MGGLDDYVYEESDLTLREMYDLVYRIPNETRQKIIDISRNRDIFRFKEAYKVLRTDCKYFSKEDAYYVVYFILENSEFKKPDGYYAYPLKLKKHY